MLLKIKLIMVRCKTMISQQHGRFQVQEVTQKIMAPQPQTKPSGNESFCGRENNPLMLECFCIGGFFFNHLHHLNQLLMPVQLFNVLYLIRISIFERSVAESAENTFLHLLLVKPYLGCNCVVQLLKTNGAEIKGIWI